MVADNDDLVRDGAVDNANDVPDRGGDIFLLVVQVDDNIIWCRANVVVNTLVLETQVLVPVLVEISRLGTMTVQSLENRKRITIRDGDRRNVSSSIVDWSPRNTGLGGIARGRSKRSVESNLEDWETYGSPGRILKNSALPR
jgi:hypothetical protein